MSGPTKGYALVTGAGSGIGRALSIIFARDGIDGITIADIKAEALDETEKEIQKINPTIQVLKVSVDVADPKSVSEMVVKALATHGRLDYAVNVAGLPPPKNLPMHEMTLETYDEICNVNSRGVFLCMQAEFRAMMAQQERQSPQRETHLTVVNVASLAGRAGVPTMSPYTSSKHAVVGMTKSAALEYGRNGIRVNAVCPGYIATPMINDWMGKRGVHEGDPAMESFKTQACWSNPMGRLGKAEEIAEVCAWLAGPKSGYVNGVAIPVDGGTMAASSFYKPM